ncbi:2-nitropropane dioxygenase [Ventosimonas gracilis]|uniref:2-nitropropane dioxygenase n=1 Tax=Ventosimonas gracilis TaxID=1680762 RepID=A0A139SNG1_9GAMM|nr:nitronate monooxygenase family protein [Ventosimonas gracilis]KXU36128.1 2-nitropropane dioxygenase [Ventosimonas gracilis]
MSLPALLNHRLRLPLVAAPMFLISAPQLVLSCCKNGVVGSFPALNQRTSSGFSDWVDEIKASLTEDDAPFAVNLIVFKGNPRVSSDLAICEKKRVPIVITSLGAVKEVVDTVHSYGGLVFHDVTTRRHAEKAAEAGVDGLIAVAAGAGGHAGTLSPFALIREIREFFDKTLLLSGSLGHGREILAAQVLGADLAYMGTRFIATQQSDADEAYKQMLLQARAGDIVYTPAVSGIPANFMQKSLEKAGYDTERLKKGEVHKPAQEFSSEEAKSWKNIWSAGHGAGSISDIPSVEALIARLDSEYQAAVRQVRSH